MSIALLQAWLSVSLMISLDVLLFVCIGVAGCGYLNSSHITRSGSNCLPFIYNAPISALAAEDITLFIIFAIIDISPFIICVLFVSFPKYVCPATLDLVPVTTKYNVSNGCVISC